MLLALIIVSIGIIVALTVISYREGQKTERWKAKATKFDDYCRRVRASLETVQLALEPPAKTAPAHVHRFRQFLANTFYSKLPQIDGDAVSRCAEPAVTSERVNRIRGRCLPAAWCDIAEPDDPKCQVDPSCVEPVVRELLMFLPRS